MTIARANKANRTRRNRAPGAEQPLPPIRGANLYATAVDRDIELDVEMAEREEAPPGAKPKKSGSGWSVPKGEHSAEQEERDRANPEREVQSRKQKLKVAREAKRRRVQLLAVALYPRPAISLLGSSRLIAAALQTTPYCYVSERPGASVHLHHDGP